MPSEKIAQFSSAPPLKRLKSAATPPPALCDEVRNQSCRTAGLTPGVVIAAPRRTITMTASVNRIRRRSSGILTVFKKAETIRLSLALELLPIQQFSFSSPRVSSPWLSLWPAVCDAGASCFVLRPERLPSGQRGALPQGHGAAGLFDFLARRCADLIGLDRQAVLQFAAAENLQPGDVAANHVSIPAAFPR